MPYLEHVAARGTGVGNDPSGGTTSLSATFSANIAEGAVVVVRVSTENKTASSGATNRHTAVVDTAGNIWEKVGEASQEEYTPGNDEGVTVSLWWTRVTAPITAGQSVTVTFADTTAGRMLFVDEYDALDPGYVVEVVGAAGAHGKTSFPSAPAISVTLTLPADEECTWIGAGAHQAGNQTLTLDGSFTTDRVKQSANGGNSANNTTLWGQYRHVFTASETWDGAIVGSQDWAMVLGAFRLREPDPPPPQPGNREWRAEFESPGHQLDHTSTVRRTDAVSWDFRTATTTGPVALDDVSDGLESHVWRVTVDGNQVLLARQNADNTAWLDPVLLTTATGDEAIDEVDAAFTETGTIFVIAERPTGSAGSPEVWIYWYDPLFSTYRWQNLGAGRSPRCCSDYFPTTVGPHVCPPEIDVQAVYLTTSGMVRLQESDRYTVEYPTVLTGSPLRRLQKLFRTTDRRVSVVYGQRNLTTGRWLLGRVDSIPYNDSLLRRPVFKNWSDPAFDIMRGLGSAGYWMHVGLETDGFALRVETQDACDAIEVAASATYPSGGLHPFDQQEQEADGGGSGYSAGGSHDFSFDITYGNGSVSLVAFRARTRRTIADITCYSPWRYVIIPPAIFATIPDVDISVNCDRDLLLSITERLSGFGGPGLMEARRETDVSAGPDPRPFVCSDTPVGPTPGYWFVGGTQNHEPSYPFPTHLVRYAWRVRGYHNFNFTDEDGHYVSTVLGDDISGGGGSPLTSPNFDWPSTRFPAQFPDDAGQMPVIPPTNDIIGIV